MKEENYISVELSRRVKAAGFDEPWERWIASKDFTYGNDDEHWDVSGVTVEEGDSISRKDKEDYDPDAFPRLTLTQVQTWLREKKGYHITIDTFYPSYLNGSRDFKDNHYQCTVVRLNGGNRTEINYFPTYEEALKAGVEVALEKIIND